MYYVKIEFVDRHGEYGSEDRLINILINTETKVALFDGETESHILKDEEDFIYEKVNDSGSYSLYDSNMNLLYHMDDEYVPDCIPNEYNDYINLEIFNGKITNWESSDEKIFEFFQDKCEIN